MREVRRTLLAGGVPAWCHYCVDSNRVAGEGYNELFNRNYGWMLPRIAKETEPDGSTRILPASIDYRTSHCNLRCRTCDARNSSSIFAERSRAGEALPPRATAAGSASGSVEPEALAEVVSIYWAGGEPFMSPVHAATMEGLAASGRAGRIGVNYTSNLSFWNEEIAAAMRRYAASFKAMSVGASIDGVGETGAYVRAGWDDARFFSHLSALRAIAPPIQVFLDVTLTNLGLLDLATLVQRCAQERLEVKFKLMERNGENDFLDVGLLAPEAIEAALRACAFLWIPPYYRQRIGEIRALMSRRYRREPFTARHRALVEKSEAQRGMAGFFAQRTAGKLNREARPVEQGAAIDPARSGGDLLGPRR
jgi:sulfatase maturation enzyme AslB (radical SAM superfamily)